MGKQAQSAKLIAHIIDAEDALPGKPNVFATLEIGDETFPDIAIRHAYGHGCGLHYRVKLYRFAYDDSTALEDSIRAAAGLSEDDDMLGIFSAVEEEATSLVQRYLESKTDGCAQIAFGDYTDAGTLYRAMSDGKTVQVQEKKTEGTRVWVTFATISQSAWDDKAKGRDVNTVDFLAEIIREQQPPF
jgi:hypothetical protein